MRCVAQVTPYDPWGLTALMDELGFPSAYLGDWCGAAVQAVLLLCAAGATNVKPEQRRPYQIPANMVAVDPTQDPAILTPIPSAPGVLWSMCGVLAAAAGSDALADAQITRASTGPSQSWETLVGTLADDPGGYVLASS